MAPAGCDGEIRGICGFKLAFEPAKICEISPPALREFGAGCGLLRRGERGVKDRLKFIDRNDRAAAA